MQMLIELGQSSLMIFWMFIFLLVASFTILPLLVRGTWKTKIVEGAA